MKNTLENKARFFAQYWGQEVLSRYDHRDTVSPVILLDVQHELEKLFLELKPLSQITDEDVIQLANMMGIKNPTIQSRTSLGVCVISGIHRVESEELNISGNYYECEYWNWISYDGSEYKELNIESIDYLRSKGYALPWMGVSVEEQTEYGWIKLTT